MKFFYQDVVIEQLETNISNLENLVSHFYINIDSSIQKIYSS